MKARQTCRSSSGIPATPASNGFPPYTKNGPLTVETMACVALGPNILRFSVRSEYWEIPSHLVEGRVDRRRHGRSKPLSGSIEAKDFLASKETRI